MGSEMCIRDRYEVTTQLWLDQHLKGTFAFPQTPHAELALTTADGIPSIAIKPDTSQPILYVDVYHTQQEQKNGPKDDRNNTINRFWHHAAAATEGGVWTAALPVYSTEKPLWVYANVVYPLAEPVTGAGYYYRSYTATKFSLSSLVHLVSPGELRAAGAETLPERSRMIETFEGGWEKDWFTFHPDE